MRRFFLLNRRFKQFNRPATTEAEIFSGTYCRGFLLELIKSLLITCKNVNIIYK